MLNESRCPLCRPLTKTEAEAWAAGAWQPEPFAACADPQHAALTPQTIPRMPMPGVVVLPEGQPVPAPNLFDEFQARAVHEISLAILTPRPG